MNDDVEHALTTLVAIERDRCLGYPESELHTDPTAAIQEALDALENDGRNTDQIVFPDDKDRLGLE